MKWTGSETSQRIPAFSAVPAGRNTYPHEQIQRKKMIIQRIWAKQLYGQIDLDLNLREGINLLVGINGSGKTTALNLVNWLLSLNIGALATTPFAEFGIELTDNSGLPTILKCAHRGRNFNIYGNVGGKTLHRINVRLNVLPSQLPENAAAISELRETYGQLTAEPAEEPLWQYIKSIGKPLSILLDRIISVHDADSLSIDGNVRVRGRNAAQTLDPTAHVISLARDRYARYQYQLIRLNDTLKSRLITSSFVTDASTRRVSSLTLEQVLAVEKKLVNRMAAWNAETTDSSGVKRYFRRFREIVHSLQIENSNTQKSVNVFNRFFADEMKRIVGLSDAFDKFESASAKLYDPLRRYLESLNQFFRDTGKELLFDETTNGLYFTGLSSAKATPNQKKSLSYLSSGERQLLILLTYIAFPPVKTNVFIIDEPELSLHPKWQHELLRNVEKLMAPNTQMIIATHSPEIVGRRTDRCVQV